MKNPRFLALLLAGILTVSLAACGGEPAPEEGSVTQELHADIVVIGAGGAGMTAAIQAVQEGATNVVVLETLAFTGGNTLRATGGLNACNTDAQAALGIEDSVELFVADTLQGGYERNDMALVTRLAEDSAAAVDWVNDIGGDLSNVGLLAGSSVKRAHRPADGAPVGPMLVSALNAKMAELEIPVLLETTATQILLDENGAVRGVTAVQSDQEPVTIRCSSVVLACGGFGANTDLVVQYAPELAGFSTTNSPGTTGDGIHMAVAAGAALVDMEQIQTHPTVNPDTQTMYTEAVRGNGAILVNKEGQRFVNELETRDVVSAAILEQTDGQCYLVFDQSVRESLAAIEGYISAGIVFQGDDLVALATEIQVPTDALPGVVEIYNDHQASGTDADFGRESMERPLVEAPFYAALCAPAVHHTMGGVKINADCEVLGEDGSAIPGLFAAGEVTGGVHGGNRLGGNAVADIVVFGRIAGSSALAYVQANGGVTEPEIMTLPEESAAPATPEPGGSYPDGSFTGTAPGYESDITVEVTVQGGSITHIQVLEQGDTEGIFEAAAEGTIRQIIQTQRSQVDAITGATESSIGVMQAVEAALAQ